MTTQNKVIFRKITIELVVNDFLENFRYDWNNRNKMIVDSIKAFAMFKAHVSKGITLIVSIHLERHQK